VDPHHLDADLDADPDSTYHPDADPDANPDSNFYLMRIRIRIFTLMRIQILLQKRLKISKIGSYSRHFCLSSAN
jgi:hypothetical protein